MELLLEELCSFRPKESHTYLKNLASLSNFSRTIFKGSAIQYESYKACILLLVSQLLTISISPITVKG